MNAIEMKNVCKSFGDFAIKDLNFELPKGAICGLVGENGAGKSTTILLLMHALRPDSGEISVLGVDNRSAAFQQVKEDVGVVLDEAYYPETLNAKQVGSIMADTYQRWDMDAYLGYLKRFDLPMTKAFKDYSRGMTMKLAIAVALSHSPKLLILDEATSGLDPMVRDEILDIFNDFTRDEGHSILLSSHIVSDLEKICDYIAFLHKGKLVLCEEKDRLLEEYALVRLPENELNALPPHCIVGRKSGGYSSEALILRSKAPSALIAEHTTLEDIILFLAKGDEKK